MGKTLKFCLQQQQKIHQRIDQIRWVFDDAQKAVSEIIKVLAWT